MPQERKYPRQADRQAAYRARTEAARRTQLQAKGLPPLPALPTMPGYPRWRAALAQATQALSGVREEMQDYFDERSEGWQEGERGLAHEERIAALQEVLETLGELAW